MAERLSKLEKAYRRYPDSPLFARLAELYLRRGRVFRALSVCEKGCQRLPDYPTGFQILSRCYAAQGDLEKARQALHRALRLDPDSPGGFRQLSGLYEELGEVDLALKSLEQVVRLDPFDPRAEEEAARLAEVVRSASEKRKREAASGGGDESTSPEAEMASEEGGASAESVAGDEEAGPHESASVAPLPDAGGGSETKGDAEEVGTEDSPVAGGWEEEAARGAPGPEEGVGKAAACGSDAAEESGATGSLGAPPAAEAPKSGAREEDDVAALGAGLFDEEPDAEGGGEEAAGLREAGEGEAKDLSAETDGTNGAPVEGTAPAGEKEAAPSHASPAGGVNAISGLAPRDDDELIRLFQEIEAQQTQRLEEEGEASSSASSSGEETADRRIATVTLAEIYAIQGLTQRAIETYEQILAQNPDDEEIKEKLAELKRGARARPHPGE